MQLQSSFVGKPVFAAKEAVMGAQIRCANGPARVVMRKKEIHPEMFEAKVICKGEHVHTVIGTMPEYQVDVWSGNHPFYLGSGGNLIEEDGRVEKFKKKFGDLSAFAMDEDAPPAEKPAEE
ncbi:hypothetical protein BSKO_05732 [Bryopsis sp. KO-2023]|nr:hypothetical protein BSKO_05732 [Bryopsis sp. KO-2023]